MRWHDPIVARACVTVFVSVVLMICASWVSADVYITRLANEGVLIEDGQGAKVMIDGLVLEPYSVYEGLPEELHASFRQAVGPFSGVDLALASHQHHDHNQPVHACEFMQASTSAVFVSSAQVMDLMREKCREFTLSSPRMQIIDPRYGEPEHIEIEGATVTAFLLSHGTGKYAALQNFGHVVEIGGMRVLHIGDAAMAGADFARAGVENMNIDIALIPFWFFQPGPGGGVVDRHMDAPHKIALHIPPSELDEVRTLLRSEYPRVILLENVLDQAQFSPTAPPPP